LGIAGVASLFLAFSDLYLAIGPRRRLFAAALGGLSLVVLWESGSASAVLGGAIAAFIAGGVGLQAIASGKAGRLTSQHPGRPARLFVPLIMPSLALLTPAIAYFGWSYLTGITASKSGTLSQTNRFAADLRALELVGQTNLLGVGIGSNRTSSLFTLLLSTTGATGTALFCLVMLMVLTNPYSDRTGSSIRATLLAWLCTAFVGVADFSSPLLWICALTLLGLRGEAAVQPKQATSIGRHHTYPAPVRHFRLPTSPSRVLAPQHRQALSSKA
jgi:hypothetical protein